MNCKKTMVKKLLVQHGNEQGSQSGLPDLYFTLLCLSMAFFAILMTSLLVIGMLVTSFLVLRPFAVRPAESTQRSTQKMKEAASALMKAWVKYDFEETLDEITAIFFPIFVRVHGY